MVLTLISAAGAVLVAISLTWWGRIEWDRKDAEVRKQYDRVLKLQASKRRPFLLGVLFAFLLPWIAGAL